MNEIVTIENQNLMTVKGATKVRSSTQNAAEVEIDQTLLLISGSDLEVKKLDLDNKEVVFSGNITHLKFVRHGEKQSLFKRVFK